MEIWPALISAIAIGLIAVSLGFGLIYRGTTLSASPIVLCSVTGLMVGIAVLVILPEAVESMIELGWKCEHIFLLFLFPPLIMFFFEHVVVEHSHDIPGDFAGAPGAAHEHDESCRHQTPIPYAMKFSTDGSPVSVSERTPLKYGKSKEGSFDRLLEDCGMTLRLCAWIAHGLMDGVLLGTASHLSVLIPLALALLICAVQDVAGLYIYFTAREANTRFVMVGICVFSAAFPLGTCISFALFRSTDNILVLDLLRCMMAGLFLYMAMFELAPREHAHSRIQNLKYLAAFCFGLASAYMADAFEDQYDHQHSHPADVGMTMGSMVSRNESSL